ncbi:uncharacterized protein LOC108032898 [Drosophila biarmipes]|uniref:uncharacterized protein LOC108032898 n=1 Tax=Drosophila biarmipes TaxID=125945 RepID=UPI0007E5C1B3|nr:uncharacterized protein LOC108032898 [Drosophila biarmipes]
MSDKAIVQENRQKGEVKTQLHVLLSKQVLSQLFPNTHDMKNLRSLTIGNISQEVLEKIFTNCGQLESLILWDRLGPGILYDIRNIGLCRMLKVLMLPLEIASPLAACRMVNLTHLTLQRQNVCPGIDWLCTVIAIIQAKRFDLQELSFDGSWLVAPLDLFRLDLASCTALTYLKLSNCNLSELSGPPLPLTCQKLGFRRCSVVKLQSYIRTHALLQNLEVFDCQVLSGAPLLRRILSMRKRLTDHEPLLLTFSQSHKLRSEYTKWTQEDVNAISRWLKVKELEPHQADTWSQPLGTVSMNFSRSINFFPNLSLPEDSILNAADIVQRLDPL